MVTHPSSATERLTAGGESSVFYPIDRVEGVRPADLARRPFTIRVLLENLLRNRDRGYADRELASALAHGTLRADQEVPFFPGRVLLQDFTGVPVVVDLTSLRAAASARGIPTDRVNPRIPVDLIVDHSIQVDSFARPNSALINLDREYDRNEERYRFLRWATSAYDQFRVVPPGNGICHQVNLEHLGSVVDRRGENGSAVVFPDTLVGTDSHTTMINGLGVLGFGVGGIEAESVLLGEPTFLPPPKVVGVRLSGRLPEGATATDLVLTVTRLLRKHGVVDKFVEFTGPGVAALTVPDRATISNMCPEYGATAALFPIDPATLDYLQGTGRPAPLIARVEAYARRQGWFVEASAPELEFDERVDVDLASIVPTISGPKNPEESVPITEVPKTFGSALDSYRKRNPRKSAGSARTYPSDDPMHPYNGERERPTSGASAEEVVPELPDGSVVIAAITSCTNTSNPSVMIGAGLIARKARALGLRPPAHVKTSLAPGSKVVLDYLERARLLPDLEAIGFGIVGFGCTTCIGNSGPLPAPIDAAIRAHDAYVAAVLSGNRNFEARIHNLVRANYLASPMLVVAYALAGRINIDLAHDPLGTASDGRPVYLRDLWPSAEEVRRTVDANLDAAMFRSKYGQILVGDRHWETLDPPSGSVYPWDDRSTYLQNPTYFDLDPPSMGPKLLEGARALAILGDAVSTDHISPAGEIPADSAAGRYLTDHGVAPADFNTYGARRGNHEVMIRGTFANVRLKNQLVAPTEGGVTVHLPEGERSSIFDAAEKYRAEKVPLVVLAGASYGQGSSRDWAAKGPRLLGVRVVLAKSYERIHRGNLVGMGVLPLEFAPGEGAQELGLTGLELYSMATTDGHSLGARSSVDVTATAPSGESRTFRARVRVDSAAELAYFRAGGLLPHVLERIREAPRPAPAAG